MADQNVLNYKCPNCSAGLTFDSKTQKMTCQYCGSSYSIDELEEKLGKYAGGQFSDEGDGADAEPASQASGQTETSKSSSESWGTSEDLNGWTEEEKNQTLTWNCPSCGASMITDKTVGAVVCPYCDNPMVMPEQFSESFRPDYVIPFQKDKKDALAALKQYYVGKPLLPKVFKDQNHLEEIRAVYVPFWLFDLDADARIQYDAARTRFWSDRDFNYTEISHFNIVRAGEIKFDGIPVDGSEKIDNTMMEAIEPYHYEDLKPFDLSYLSGYMANKYDQKPEELKSRVYERMKKTVMDEFRDTVRGYESVIPRKENIQVKRQGKVKYGLLPVWFLNTKWNGQDYAFAMNGQTGKLIGDLPVGKDLAVHYWLKLHIPFAVLIFGVLTALRLLGVI